MAYTSSFEHDIDLTTGSRGYSSTNLIISGSEGPDLYGKNVAESNNNNPFQTHTPLKHHHHHHQSSTIPHITTPATATTTTNPTPSSSLPLQLTNTSPDELIRMLNPVSRAETGPISDKAVTPTTQSSLLSSTSLLSSSHDDPLCYFNTCVSFAVLRPGFGMNNCGCIFCGELEPQ